MLFYYASGSIVYLAFLVIRLTKDLDTSNNDHKSWQVIAIATLLWPVVIPLSYLELRSKAKARAKLDAMPKPMSFGVNARYIKTVQLEEVTNMDSNPQLQAEQ